MPPVKKEPSLWENLKESIKPVDETYYSPGFERSLANAVGLSKPKKQEQQPQRLPDFKRVRPN